MKGNVLNVNTRINRNVAKIAAAAAAIIILANPAGAQTRHKKVKKAHVDSTKAAVLNVVSKFEAAYKVKDKKTMIFALMVPTKEAEALEKRYQWFRGYGPTDMPGSRHPPILFETSKGSFVPSSYYVTTVTPDEPNTWKVNIHEHGTYHDEDGRYDVQRLRQMTVMKYNGKYYVSDYVMMDNPTDYGFYVDDISDKMIHLQ